MAAIDFLGDLGRVGRSAVATKAKERHKPAPPPENLFDIQFGVFEGGPQLLRVIAPAMALHSVELREELGQSRYAHNQDSTGPDEPRQIRQHGAIVINVFYHIEGQNGIKR